MTTTPENNKCGRHARTTGNPCQHPQGFRTKHPGSGACWLHGGASPGAPKGNKNAVVTGEYETLYFSALGDDERQLYQNMDLRPRVQTEQSLRMTSVREHRILLRIARFNEMDGEMAITEQSHSVGEEQRGSIDYKETKRTPILETIMRLEDALTRVQNLKTKLIDQLRAIILETPEQTGGLDAIVEAIDRSARFHAEQELNAAIIGEADDALALPEL